MGTNLVTPTRKNARSVSQPGVSARYFTKEATVELYMNTYGIKKRIDALNHKFLVGYDQITRIERQIMIPAPRIEGEPHLPTAVPTGKVIIRKVNV